MASTSLKRLGRTGFDNRIRIALGSRKSSLNPSPSPRRSPQVASALSALWKYTEITACLPLEDDVVDLDECLGQKRTPKRCDGVSRQASTSSHRAIVTTCSSISRKSCWPSSKNIKIQLPRLTKDHGRPRRRSSPTQKAAFDISACSETPERARMWSRGY
jgi:hypothetical protein